MDPAFNNNPQAFNQPSPTAFGGSTLQKIQAGIAQRKMAALQQQQQLGQYQSQRGSSYGS